jgi:hypothetical protein
MSSESTSEPEPTSLGYLSCCGFRESASIAYALDLSHLEECVTVLREALDHIESMDFAVHAGLASGCSVLKRFFEEDPQVQKLTDLCHDSRELAVFLLGHMLLLTTLKFDEKYSNPHDHAMAAYLHILTTSRNDITLPAVNTARRLRNAFWPERYIKSYLS